MAGVFAPMVALAIAKVLNAAYGIEHNTIPLEVGRVLGFGRVSEDMRARIETVIRQMIKHKLLMQRGTRVIVRKEKA